MVRVEGREGRKPSYAIAVGSHPVQPLSIEETSSIQSFVVVQNARKTLEASVLDKRKIKYDVYDNTLEDFADIPFKLSDIIGQISRIWMGKKMVSMSIILKKNLTLRKKSTKYVIIQKQKNF